MTPEERAQLERMLRRARIAADAVTLGNDSPRVLEDARQLFARWSGARRAWRVRRRGCGRSWRTRNRR